MYRKYIIEYYNHHGDRLHLEAYGANVDAVRLSMAKLGHTITLIKEM